MRPQQQLKSRHGTMRARGERRREREHYDSCLCSVILLNKYGMSFIQTVCRVSITVVKAAHLPVYYVLSIIYGSTQFVCLTGFSLFSVGATSVFPQLASTAPLNTCTDFLFLYLLCQNHISRQVISVPSLYWLTDSCNLLCYCRAMPSLNWPLPLHLSRVLVFLFCLSSAKTISLVR